MKNTIINNESNILMEESITLTLKEKLNPFLMTIILNLKIFREQNQKRKRTKYI